MLKTLVLIVLSTIGGLAQVTEQTTVPLLTGRAWELMPEATKIAYLEGVRNGIVIAANNMPDNLRKVGFTLVEDNLAKRFTNDDYRNELDTLYRDRENVPIPVILGYQYVTVKLKGQTTKQELERRLIEVRKVVAQ
jgi:hypothetical protein